MQPNKNPSSVCKSLTFSDLALLLGIFFFLNNKKKSIVFYLKVPWNGNGTFILRSEPNVNTHAGV